MHLRSMRFNNLYSSCRRSSSSSLPLLTLFLAAFLSSCQQGDQLFELRKPQKSGVQFANNLDTDQDIGILDYLYYYNGGGVAIGDINNDSLPDIFFTANQGPNQLYLNKGGLQFENISTQAGVEGKSSWNTGSVMADVNGDGWLDIYVCAVVGIQGFRGHNELFINQKDGTFKESAAQFGLDQDSYSSSAAFFDFDLDGDLDLYLLNHAVHTQESFGRVDLREKRIYETGDKLFRNEGGKFVDVSEEAGIYGGVNAYGLGLCISDFNKDGYPDIFVGNDFHEDDYFYLNNGDGTFTESLRNFFGHTSRFSMGNDAADLNFDGRPDLVSLDMLPQDEFALKSTEGDDNLQTQKMRIEQYGYHYQFTRNMLYINQEKGGFMEAALSSGIAATDWSWGALFADFNLDGRQDLFITNGIPQRPNDLDFIRFVSDEQIKNKIDNTRIVDQEALELMPNGFADNYIFEGQAELQFLDRSQDWLPKGAKVSNSVAWGDLDRDGDLDLVTNNLNEVASLYINTGKKKGHHLVISLRGETPNSWGIGSQVTVFADGKQHYRELFPNRGFQASSEPKLFFGLGEIERIDSVQVVWPGGVKQTLRGVQLDQQLTVNFTPDNSSAKDAVKIQKSPTLFIRQSDQLGIQYTHKEDNYSHFNREKLIPFSVADRGPAVLQADLDGDGKEDLLFGGSKFYPPQFFIQSDSAFIASPAPLPMAADSIKEWVSLAAVDLNQDGEEEVIAGSGGADFYGQSKSLMDAVYQKKDSFWVKETWPSYFTNTSILLAFDVDQDGDQDLWVGNQMDTGRFGLASDSYLLLNKGQGQMEIAQTFSLEGMPTAALWTDRDEDGIFELLVVGEWMSPQWYRWDGSQLQLEDSNLPSGLWQSLASFDYDQDGDLDYLIGNWGTNTKFKASNKDPLRLYTADFDSNGQTEAITAIAKEGQYFPIAGLDDLASQMVSLRKKFTTYTSFAGKTLPEILGKEELKKAHLWKVEELRSGVLRNENGRFEFVPFAWPMQLAPIMEILVFDFNGDGQKEALLGGNYFGVKPYQGRFDSFPGALWSAPNQFELGSEIGLQWQQKSLRHLRIVEKNNIKYLLAVFNDEAAEVYKIETDNPNPPIASK